MPMAAWDGLLLDKARRNLRLLGIRNVDMKHADGSLGWPERKPFDAIITTAAPQHVPDELKGQLAEGGRLIIPVGGEHHQELKLITRRGDGFEESSLDLVRFVPLLTGQVQH